MAKYAMTGFEHHNSLPQSFVGLRANLPGCALKTVADISPEACGRGRRGFPGSAARWTGEPCSRHALRTQ